MKITSEQIKKDVEWCKLVREKVDSIIISQAKYESECG